MTHIKNLGSMLLSMLLILGFSNTQLNAQQTLKPGDKAPVFSLKNQDGNAVNLADYIGTHTIVLFFYPKDESPVCTEEACAFRDAYALFTDADAVVIGINSGTVESHKKFHVKDRLPFDLLSDPGNKILDAYGVKQEDLGNMKISGRETFVIGKDGNIVYRFRDFMKGKAHSEKVLTYLKGQ